MDPDNKNPGTIINVQPSDTHHGKQISSVSVSPNGTCVVTFSRKDKSIERWIVNEDDNYSKWIPLDRVTEVTKKLSYNYRNEPIKVSDDKVVFYGEYSLNPSPSLIYNTSSEHYYFKKNGNFVIFISWLSKILVFSPQNNDLILVSSYELLGEKEKIIVGTIEDNNKI